MNAVSRLNATSRQMADMDTETTEDRLRRQTDLSIWLAIHNAGRPLRADALATTSRTAVHYGIGGAIHDITSTTVALRAGLQLGILQTAPGKAK